MVAVCADSLFADGFKVTGTVCILTVVVIVTDVEAIQCQVELIQWAGALVLQTCRPEFESRTTTKAVVCAHNPSLGKWKQVGGSLELTGLPA